MNTNNFILNRLFTQNVLQDFILKNGNPTYKAIIQKHFSQNISKYNIELICDIYKYMSVSYRNEYFYKNTLFNKLLLGKHSLNTTTALTEISIYKSKADFILINGKAVVYEIKSELDTFDRLNSQLNDYYKAFNHVCVVTSDKYYDKITAILKDTPVGIYVLTQNNTLSSVLKKEPIENNSKLDYLSIFKLLRKYEFENVIREHFGELPIASQVHYYNECYSLFQTIPLLKAYKMTLTELKKRNKVTQDFLEKIPYELKSLIYFSKSSLIKDITSLNKFLNQKYQE